MTKLDIESKESNRIKLSDLWEQILELDEGDPPIRLRVLRVEDIVQIKKSLSMYKFRELKANPDLKEVLGDFHLSYEQDTIDELILSISIEYRVSAELPATLLTTKGID